MFPLLTSLFSLIEASLNYLSEDKRTELSRRYLELKQNILNENLKPVDQQDHARLEKWYQQVPIVLESIAMELNVAHKKS